MINMKAHDVLSSPEWHAYSAKLYEATRTALINTEKVMMSPRHGSATKKDATGIFVTELRRGLAYGGIRTGDWFHKGEKKFFREELRFVNRLVLDTKNWAEPGVLRPGYTTREPMAKATMEVVSEAMDDATGDFHDCWSTLDQIKSRKGMMDSCLTKGEALVARADQLLAKLTNFTLEG